MTCTACEDCPFVEETNRIFHEIHVTVKTDGVEQFFSVCQEHKIKAVVITDFRSEDEFMTHVMTSQKLEGSDTDALKELGRIKEVFSKHNFEIIREKIETNLNADRDYDKGYFESHLQFEVEDLSAFKRIISRIGGIRLSKNDGKKNTILATVRSYTGDPYLFKKQMEAIKSKFYDYGYATEKLIIEFCWLDTNIQQDADWKSY